MRLAILLAAMMRLSTHGDVRTLAEAIAASDATWDEATWLAAIAYRESSYRLRAVGDHGRSLGPFQCQHCSRGVLTDAHLATRVALHALRASAALCPSSPLAAYAGAPCGSAVAGRISRDRDALRRRMFGGAP